MKKTRRVICQGVQDKRRKITSVAGSACHDRYSGTLDGLQKRLYRQRRAQGASCRPANLATSSRSGSSPAVAYGSPMLTPHKGSRGMHGQAREATS